MRFRLVNAKAADSSQPVFFGSEPAVADLPLEFWTIQNWRTAPWLTES